MGEWLKPPDCKSGLYEFAGSNPALPIFPLMENSVFWEKLMPDGVTGNTTDFESVILGSIPNRAILF